LFFLDGRHPLADTRHAVPVRRDIGPPLAEADSKFVKYVSKFVVIVAEIPVCAMIHETPSILSGAVT
jgi:hypothetical protein